VCLNAIGRLICIALNWHQNYIMTILKSLIAAPLLICGVTICSPVSAETVVDNDITSVMTLTPAARKAIKDLRAKDPSATITVRHKIKWGDLQRHLHLQGCPGGVEYSCEPNNTYGNLNQTVEITK